MRSRVRFIDHEVIFITKESSRTHILIVLTLATFLPAFMSSALNIALPSLGDELSVDAVFLGWVASSYLLAMAIFQVPSGRAGDIYGRKKIFSIGMAVFAAFSLLCALPVPPAALIVFRFMQGAGSAMIFATVVAILTSVFPAGERGRVLGINVTAVYLGLSIGPFLGGIMTQYLGWRSIMLTSAILCFVLMATIYLRLSGDWAGAKGESFDWIGLLLYAATLTSMMYGFTLLPAQDARAYLLAAVISFLAFVWWELSCEEPILNIRLLRGNRAFAFSNLAAMINYAATFAVAFLLSMYLQYIKGMDPQTAGFIMIFQPLVQAVFSPVAGIVSDKMEPRLVASAGMAITAVGLLLLTSLDWNTAVSYLLMTMVILGIGLALFSAPNTNAVMSSVDMRNYGVASGLVGTMRSIGMMISMGIVMLVFSVSVGRVQINPEHYPSFLHSLNILFSIFLILCLVGTAASMARGCMRSGDAR